MVKLFLCLYIFLKLRTILNLNKTAQTVQKKTWQVIHKYLLVQMASV